MRGAAFILPVAAVLVGAGILCADAPVTVWSQDGAAIPFVDRQVRFRGRMHRNNGGQS